MFLTRSEYDRGVNTFSPEGRLLQLEYANQAIKLGCTAIGISTSEGVVLAVEKRVTSPLMEPTTIEKIVEIDKHIGCASSGFMADSRTLIDRARVECQNHWFIYNEKMTVESAAQAVSNLAIQFGDSDDDGSAMSRPFGVAILFAGIDEHGPQLFHMDPSGTFVQFDAMAIGSGSEGAQQSLQEVYHKGMVQFSSEAYFSEDGFRSFKDNAAWIFVFISILQYVDDGGFHLFVQSMTLKEAITSVLTILKQVMEEKLSDTNIEVMTMTPGKMFYMFTKEELQEVIKDIA